VRLGLVRLGLVRLFSVRFECLEQAFPTCGPVFLLIRGSIVRLGLDKLGLVRLI
jgi:hypothetical protein